MSTFEKLNEYLAEEKKRYDALVAENQRQKENDVDKFLAENDVSEQLDWRIYLVSQMAERMPADVATKAIRDALGEEYMKQRSKYMLNETYTFTNASVQHVKDRFQEIVDSFSSHLDEAAIEEVIKEADAYVPPRKRHAYEYPLQGTVSSLKESVQLSDRSAEEKESMTALLDHANEITRQGNAADAQRMSTYSLGISRAIFSESKKILFEAIENGEASGVLKRLNRSIMTESLCGKPDTVEMLKNTKIVLGEQDKAHYLKVLKTMQKHELLRPENPTQGEESKKTFAFCNIMTARNAVREALVAGDFDAMKKASEEYEKQMDAMRDVYRVAAEELGEDLHGFPDNVDNQRNSEIPIEFKEHYKLNAAVNGLYLLLELARDANVTVEQVLEDPAKVSLDYMKSFSEKYTLTEFSKGKSLGEALAYASNLNPQSIGEHAPSYLATRPIEALNVLSQDPSLKKQNLLAEHMVGALCVEYDNEPRRSMSFFTTELDKSVVNMFLMGEEGMRNPGLMSRDGYYDNNTLEHIPGLRPEDYLENQPADPAKLKAYIEKTFLEYTSNVKMENPQITQVLLEGTRGAVREAILFGNMDLKSPEAVALLRLYQDPKKELIAAGVDSKKLTAKLPLKSEKDLINEDKNVRKNTKARMSYDKKIVRAEEKYNKKASKMEKRIADAEEKLANAKDEKTKQKLTRSKEALQQKLETLKEKEMKRLDGERAAGKLTDVYYQRRTGDVKENLYATKRDLYNDTVRIDKKDFIEAQMASGCTKQEAVQSYAKIEAQNVLNARNVVVRRREDRAERQTDLAKTEAPKVEKGSEKAEKAAPQVIREAEKQKTIVKQLDLSDMIRKPASREVVKETQPEVVERNRSKEMEEQVR